MFVKLGASAWIAMHCVEVIADAIFGWFVYKTISYYADPRWALVLGAVAILNPFLVMVHYKYHGFAWHPWAMPRTVCFCGRFSGRALRTGS